MKDDFIKKEGKQKIINSCILPQILLKHIICEWTDLAMAVFIKKEKSCQQGLETKWMLWLQEC